MHPYEEQKVTHPNKMLKAKDAHYRNTLLSTWNVTLYQYTGTWIKTQTEGALYIYRRHQIPSACLFLINRKNPNDYHLPISKEILQVERHSQFLIVKIAEKKELLVHGFWFSEKEKAKEAEDLFNECIKLSLQSIELLHVIRNTYPVT
ncbi:hypothetical protein NEFER03_1564 [Nematocida sp. LUAm3]|nr:hypothetical protein NEFER03_1564 [Nematocida sp. LUAm3]KAI5174597.1 hypothetical protein NEFER02_0718 [Nematocida sp. LUAm2]KAI5177997.1 hypothetical protein NEFER01_1179 [Nematocida sp. LUAm1]